VLADREKGVNHCCSARPAGGTLKLDQ